MKLHVLLRHRLLLEAEVGEGAVALSVQNEPRHLAVPDVEHSGSVCAHLPEVQSACLAAAAGRHGDKDALVIKLAVLVRFDADILPRAQPPAEALGHPV